MKIRGDIIRTYQSIHTWTGIITGLVLFIGFYAGSLTMFKPAIEQWATPTAQELPQVSVNQLDLLISEAANQQEKVKQGFIINFDENSSPMMWYEKGGGRGLRLDDELTHATLNEQAQLIKHQDEKNMLGALIDQLHRTAGIVGKVGHEDLGVLVLGIAAGLYFLALISGVIFLLPTLVKSLFALRQNKGASRFWLDSHNLVGVVSLPFHFVIAWTAVVFALHDPFYGGLSVVYGDRPLFERAAPSETTYEFSSLPPIQRYIEKVDELAPNHTLQLLEFSRLASTSPSVAIEVKANDQMMRGGYSDIIYMNPFTMEVEYSTVFNEDSSNYGPIVSSFFALHFGNYAGNFGRWVYFALGILGAFLFYSGNLLWLEKRRKKQNAQSKSSKIMAALTIGVCFGSILGVVVSMLASKWLYLYSKQINIYYMYLYYGSFFAAIGYCLWRGAARGAIHIQTSLALACLAIVATTAVGHLLPHLALASNFQQSNYFVELIALIFAVLFYLSAKKTKQRALEGDKYSVWAIEADKVKLENKTIEVSTTS